MKPETEHLIQTLRTAMRVLGFTNAELERRLGVSGGYLTRLFGGVMELRFEHIIDIARAMGLELEEILQLAYPQPRNPPTEASQRLRETLSPLQAEPAFQAPAPQPATPDLDLDQELERTVKRILLKVLGDLGKSVA
jgi:transcriptional regulator with XRE-family HTH domain